MTTSPESSPWRARIDVERLVEDDLLAPAQLDPVDLGVHGHPHLAATGEDVDGAVVVGVQEGPVGARRLGELVHLFAQRGDVLLGLLQRVGQLLVLRDGLGQLALGLEEPLLERLDPAGPLRQAPAQDARPPPRPGGTARAGGRAPRAGPAVVPLPARPSEPPPGRVGHLSATLHRPRCQIGAPGGARDPVGVPVDSGPE